MRRLAAATTALGLATALAACGGDDEEPGAGSAPSSEATSAAPSASGSTSAEPTPSEEPSSQAPSSSAPAQPDGPPEVVSTVATGLEAPWGLDFFPDGDAIVTERDSRRVLRVTPEGEVTELGVVEEAAPDGGGAENGLLGVALSPSFEDDGWVYLYLTTESDNRVVRARLDGDRLGPARVLLDGIPRGFIHDGGRLEFGPDGMLYVSTGEAGQPELAPDRGSLGGKVLRLTPEGDPAPGNPFDSPVFSYGHRNVQGLAFDDAGTLWASEFGQNAFDELNRIEPGGDFGWPAVEGQGGGSQYVDPQQVWPTSDASPSGLAYADGALWMAALQGERLWRVTVDGRRAVEPTAFFVGEYGRMRTVATAPDGTLWVTTSNRDGRGDPAEQDDRILQVRP